MTDLDLKQALAPLFDDEPIPTPAARRVEIGYPALRRRRTTGVAVVAAAVITGGAAIGLGSLPRGTESGGFTIRPTGKASPTVTADVTTPPASPLADALPAISLAPADATDLTERCLNSPDVTEEVKGSFFGQEGAATITAGMKTPTVTQATYSSADGTMWATCELLRGAADADLQIYTTKRDESGGLWPSLDPRCPTDTTCVKLLQLRSQLPEKVAAVRVEHRATGKGVTVRTNHGWFVAIADTPRAAADEYGAYDVEYYDAKGTTLAYIHGEIWSADPGDDSDLDGIEAYPGLDFKPEYRLGYVS
ncbi:hypothetical protein [Nocardioides speluncae]|uniref:hypothetical protein n=1 Tax=Nocardioides speluncae TaxID=2670337 RepID=UPI000D68A2F9|nr:hypothetical protein [Nocardioides speluncae]